MFTKSRQRFAAWMALLGMLAFGTAVFTGCQTVKGAGQDIQNLGEAGEDAINGD